jgi:hypothetical protein
LIDHPLGYASIMQVVPGSWMAGRIVADLQNRRNGNGGAFRPFARNLNARPLLGTAKIGLYDRQWRQAVARDPNNGQSAIPNVARRRI